MKIQLSLTFHLLILEKGLKKIELRWLNMRLGGQEMCVMLVCVPTNIVLLCVSKLGHYYWSLLTAARSRAGQPSME